MIFKVPYTQPFHDPKIPCSLWHSCNPHIFWDNEIVIKNTELLLGLALLQYILQSSILDEKYPGIVFLQRRLLFFKAAGGMTHHEAGTRPP